MPLFSRNKQLIRKTFLWNIKTSDTNKGCASTGGKADKTDNFSETHAIVQQRAINLIFYFAL